MLKQLAILLLVGLVGCASVQQAIGGYQTAAGVTLRAAEDNAISAWAFAACATPYSAMLRNPRIIPALRALCGQPATFDPSAGAVPAYTTQPASQP